MSGKELPKPLQVTLNGLLMDNKLSSWQIKGGDYFIQVTIRFSAGESETDKGNVNKNHRFIGSTGFKIIR